jgi:hypothetical protein
VSANKAGFDLREITPLSRNNLHTSGVTAHRYTGQRADQKVSWNPTGHRVWLLPARHRFQQATCSTLLAFGIPQSADWVRKITATFTTSRSPSL